MTIDGLTSPASLPSPTKMVNSLDRAWANAWGIFQMKCVEKKASVTTPLFIPNDYEQSFAELGEEIKNSLSHRKNALEKAIADGLFDKLKS